MSERLTGISSETNSRRNFMKASSVAAVAGTLGITSGAYAAGSDEVKIALIGCGGRGTGAAVQALSTTAKVNVKLVAMADAFEERLQGSLKSLLKQPVAERMDVPKERQFVGLDAYQKAIDCGVDMVLLCTPPGFRPAMFEAAVAAGKHVFMEKPVATDGPGVRHILETNKIAKEKGLLVAVGHHMRHEATYKEMVKQVQDGVVGEIQFLRAYFDSSGVWNRPRKPGQTEMEHQINNWYYFTWLSGDHIVEQHVHDLDICNWIMKGHPVEAQGTGGRQVRIGKEYGEIFDHHSIQFTYADGTKMFSECRHIPGCWNSFSQHAHGTKGVAHLIGHHMTELELKGQKPQRRKRGPDGHQVEHDDLFNALIAGRSYNEADYGASSTMTAILGRMASYSGKLVTWDKAINSKFSLAPSKISWDAEPLSKPNEDGIYNCALPGISKAF